MLNSFKLPRLRSFPRQRRIGGEAVLSTVFYLLSTSADHSSSSAVASLGGAGGRVRTAPVTPSRGWHPKEKNLWTNLQIILEKRGRPGKKVVGWHPRGGWHPSESNKSDSDSEKRSPGFSGKNRGVTPSVAAPGISVARGAVGAPAPPGRWIFHA